MNRQDEVLQNSVAGIFKIPDHQTNLLTIVNMQMPVMTFIDAKVRPPIDDRGYLGRFLRLGYMSEHVFSEKLANENFSVLDSPLALLDKARRISRQDGVPNELLGLIGHHVAISEFQLRQNCLRGDAVDLRIDWAQVRLLTDDDLFTGTGDDGSRRHCDLCCGSGFLDSRIS